MARRHPRVRLRRHHPFASPGWDGVPGALRSRRFAAAVVVAAVGSGLVASLGAGHAAGLGAGPLGSGSVICQPAAITGVTTPQGHYAVSGNGGDTVTVTGSGFAQPGCTVQSVQVGSVSISNVAVNSDTKLQFTLPALTSGIVNVVVADTLGNTATSQGTDTVVSAPSVSPVSPQSVAEGATLAASGAGLTLSGLHGESVTAQFGGCAGATSVPASLDSDSRLHLAAPGVYCDGATTLVFSVPYNTASGATDPPISVPVGAGSIDITAVVAGVSPSGAVPAGGQVTVSGAGLGNDGSANLAGVPAAATWNDKAITVTVPDAASTGALALHRSADGASVGPVVNGAVQAPRVTVQARIDTVSPQPVAPGETLDIVGGGFGGSGALSIGAQALTVQSWTPMEIRAAVPAGTTSGALHVVPALDVAPAAAPDIAVGDVVATTAVNPSGPQHVIPSAAGPGGPPSAPGAPGAAGGAAGLAGPFGGPSAGPAGPGGAPGVPGGGGGRPGGGPAGSRGGSPVTGSGGSGSSVAGSAGGGAATTLVTPAVIPAQPGVPAGEWVLFGCVLLLGAAFVGYRRLMPVPATADGAAAVLRDPGAALLGAAARAVRFLPIRSRWWALTRRGVSLLLALSLVFVYLISSVLLLSVVLLLISHGSGSAVFYSPEGTIYRAVAVVLSVALTAIALRYAYYYRCWYTTRHHFGHPAAIDAAALAQRDIPFMKFQVTTKGGALPVVERSLRELEGTLGRHQWLPARICAEVITEVTEEAEYLERAFEGSVLEVHGICLPPDYATPNGTRLKARALHYMAEQRRSGINARPGRTYIVHLDEETLVTEPHLLLLVDYLSRAPRPVSQGPIFYPLEWTTAPWICRSLECTRPFGCSECARVMENPPPPHLHGSNLVVEEQVENRIGWDFGTIDGNAYVAEDLLFGLRAYALLGRDCFGWHGATMLEQPPLSLYWAVQQRMRWVLGALQGVRAMWQAAEYEAMAVRDKLRLTSAIGFRIATYSLGFPIGLAGLAYILHPLSDTSTNWASPFMIWRLAIILSAFGWLASYQIGVVRNLRYQQVSRLERVRSGAVMLVMTPITGLCETVGPFIALVRWLLGIRGARWTPTPKLVDGSLSATLDRNPRRLARSEEAPVVAAVATDATPVVEAPVADAALRAETTVELSGAPVGRSRRRPPKQAEKRPS